MILGFNKQFPDKILQGTKIHTIREDKHNRWKAGMLIQFATGVRTKQYNCFKTGQCTGTRRISINPTNKKISIIINGCQEVYLSPSDIGILSGNDGFNTVQEFWQWFNKPFEGKVIFWTEKTF